MSEQMTKAESKAYIAAHSLESSLEIKVWSLHNHVEGFRVWRASRPTPSRDLSKKRFGVFAIMIEGFSVGDVLPRKGPSTFNPRV